jgi:predicted transport protein
MRDTHQFHMLTDIASEPSSQCGERVRERRSKRDTAFRRLSSFACVFPYRNRLLMSLKLNPASVAFEDGFSRDVSAVGHWGTGDV